MQLKDQNRFAKYFLMIPVCVQGWCIAFELVLQMQVGQAGKQDHPVWPIAVRVHQRVVV
jgi:hypothetical protein